MEPGAKNPAEGHLLNSVWIFHRGQRYRRELELTHTNGAANILTNGPPHQELIYINSFNKELRLPQGKSFVYHCVTPESFSSPSPSFKSINQLFAHAWNIVVIYGLEPPLFALRS